MFQGQDQDSKDKPEGEAPRRARVVWDDETRRIMASIISEAAGNAAAKAVEAMVDQLGVDGVTHAEQHKMLGVLIPWIEAQKALAEKRAEFLDKFIRSNVERLFTFFMWFVAISVLLGFSGAWEIIRAKLGAP